MQEIKLQSATSLKAETISHCASTIVRFRHTYLGTTAPLAPVLILLLTNRTLIAPQSRRHHHRMDRLLHRHHRVAGEGNRARGTGIVAATWSAKDCQVTSIAVGGSTTTPRMLVSGNSATTV